MDIGMVGLGRMGGNMARADRAGTGSSAGPRTRRRWRRWRPAEGWGHARWTSWSTSSTAPRAVWVMVPAGDATEETVRALAELLSPGDAVVDGGNSFFKDDVRRARLLADQGASASWTPAPAAASSAWTAATA